MTHQIKISERESEAFPLSSWGCSLHCSPSSVRPLQPAAPHSFAPARRATSRTAFSVDKLPFFAFSGNVRAWRKPHL